MYSKGQYFLFIDLELTGLDINFDKILEVDFLMVNSSTFEIIDTINIIIHQNDETIDKMCEFVNSMHSKKRFYQKFSVSLIDLVKNSKINEKEAELKLLEFLKKNIFIPNIDSYIISLQSFQKQNLINFEVPDNFKINAVGSSVYTDLRFIKKYFPNLYKCFSHQVIDVTTLLLLDKTYFKGAFSKPFNSSNHTAREDNINSMKLMKHYVDLIYSPLICNFHNTYMLNNQYFFKQHKGLKDLKKNKRQK